jgi:glycosyltransferase involved in cell wall biosynthesis
MATPRLSIIIPTLREGAFIERTLGQFKDLDLPHEVIVTDGGSTDETLEIVRRFTEKIVVWDQSRRQTFGEAKNAGAALAAGDFLVFIDADVLIPEPNVFFRKALGLFDENEKLVALTVPLQPWPENHSILDRVMSAPLNWFYVFANNLLHVGNSSGEFQMVRRSAFTQIGGFAEALAAGEDNELFRALSNIGRTRSCRQLFVQHSLRRAHKLGWMRTYAIWIRNGLSVMLRGRAAYNEWSVIR